MMPFGRHPSLVPPVDVFSLPVTDEQRELAWQRVEVAVDRAVRICERQQIPLMAVATIVGLYVESLRGVMFDIENERGRARITLINKIERLRNEREPKRQKFGDCGEENHDLLNMDDEQLAAEQVRLEALPKLVP